MLQQVPARNKHAETTPDLRSARRCGDIPSPYIPDRGDLVWISFQSTSRSRAGRSASGLVLSPKSYNAQVGLALFCPVTNQAKRLPFEVVLPAGAISGVVL